MEKHILGQGRGGSNFVHACDMWLHQIKYFRLSGVVDGKMMLQVDRVKAWSSFFQIYPDGHFQPKCQVQLVRDSEYIIHLIFPAFLPNHCCSCCIVGRDDALTEAVMFWNERKVLRLSKHLSLRIHKVCKIHTCVIIMYVQKSLSCHGGKL